MLYINISLNSFSSLENVWNGVWLKSKCLMKPYSKYNILFTYKLMSEFLATIYTYTSIGTLNWEYTCTNIITCTLLDVL